MENIVEVVVVCVVGMLLSFLAGLTHKYLLQRYAQLERLRQPLLPGRGGSGLSRRKYGSQHRLGSNYSFDSAPTAAALIPKVGPAQAPTTPTAAHSSQMSNYSSGAATIHLGGTRTDRGPCRIYLKYPPWTPRWSTSLIGELSSLIMSSSSISLSSYSRSTPLSCPSWR